MNMNEIEQWKKDNTTKIIDYDFDVTVNDADNVIERFIIDNGRVSSVNIDEASLDIEATGDDIIVDEVALTDELLEKSEIDFEYLKKTMSKYMEDNIILDVSNRGYPTIMSTHDFIGEIIAHYKNSL